MIGLIAGAAAGALGGLFGGLSRNKQIETQQKAIEKSKQENQDWYNRRYNEDSTQRADAQRILSITEEAIKRRNRGAAGRAAVMGGTDNAVAATKEANANAMANAAGQISSQGEARKERVEQQYLNRKQNLDDQYNGLEAQRKNGFDFVSDVLGGASGGLSSLASLGGLFGGKKDQKGE